MLTLLLKAQFIRKAVAGGNNYLRALPIPPKEKACERISDNSNVSTKVQR